MADGTAISCQEVVEVITDYLEGKLSPEEVAIFEKRSWLPRAATVRPGTTVQAASA